MKAFPATQSERSRRFHHGKVGLSRWLPLLALHHRVLTLRLLPQRVVALFALLASASAFAPVSGPFGVRQSMQLNALDYGKYDDRLWDNTGAYSVN